jgi:uncharacterized Zn finger protein
MSRYYNSYPKYVSVRESKELSAKALKKLQTKNPNISPVIISGTKIAKSFWGIKWCENIESYQDYSNRLPRGRSYVRNGCVIDLQITPGKVEAIVSGSSNYKVEIKIKALEKEKWEALKDRCQGKISNFVELLKGNLPDDVIEEFCNQKTGLFPQPSEITTNCNCPDWASLCKHLAAVLYGIGARLDENPSLFFTLRNVDGNELISSNTIENLTSSAENELNTQDLSSVFGVDFDDIPVMDIPDLDSLTSNVMNEDKANISSTKKTTKKKSSTVKKSVAKKENTKEEILTKKKVGRPKKSTATVKVAVEEVSSKKKVGRPKKRAATAKVAVEEVSPKKKVGRPKKRDTTK